MLKISYATNLALHAMGILAGRYGDGEADPITVNQLALHLGVSENHLAKVMQRLARAGLVKSNRGPRGGFVLAKRPREVRLLDIYETLEGPMPETVCMLEQPICRGNECLLGDLLGSIYQQVRNHLTNTTLASLDWSYHKLVSLSHDPEVG